MSASDIYSNKKRSEIMSNIGSANTAPEVALRKELHRMGFRFRLNSRNLPGKPDIVLPKYQTAIFVHGCFWHGHYNCKKAALPKTNQLFWKRKLLANKDRDKRVISILKKSGWKVLVAWECKIKSDVSKIAKDLRKEINS